MGCSGGLGGKGSDLYSSWACVHTPQCNQLVTDDLACFRYSHVRGEFQFWGWNSELNLAPPLFQVEASFCTFRGTSLLDARNAEFKDGISLFDTTYVFYSVDRSGQLTPFRSGSARLLEPNGCGPVMLRSATTYWLELDAGSDFYIWKGYFQSLGPDPMEIALAIYPKLDQCDSLGITLQVGFSGSLPHFDWKFHHVLRCASSGWSTF